MTGTARSAGGVRIAGVALALAVSSGGLGAAAASAAVDPHVVAEVSSAEARAAEAWTLAAAESDGVDSSTLLGKVQDYAAQLEEDTLVSDDASKDLYGDAFDDLRALQERAAVPTYLIFDAELDFSQETTVAQLLAEVLPGDEFVVLVVGSGRVAPEVEVVAPNDDRRYLLQEQFYSTTMSGVRGESILGQLKLGLERLEDPQRQQSSSSGNSFLRWVQYQVVAYPLRTFAIVVGFIAIVAVALWFLIPRGAKRKRYRIPKAIATAAAAADRGAMRKALGDDALDVVARLEKLQTGGLDRDAADVVEHGLDAYGLARRIADDDASREDDLAGAMVLMGIAEASVTQVEKGGKGDRGRFRLRGRGQGGNASAQQLCSVDPRHGSQKKTIEADVAGRAGTLTVPACAKCVHDAENSNPLRWLTVDGTPYVLRGTVWAKTLYGGTETDLVDAVVAARATA